MVNFRYLSRFLLSSWSRQYADARLILELNGDIHYFNLSARLQKLCVRYAIVLMAVVTSVMFALLLLNVGLAIGKSRLEKSHEAVYRALLGSASDGIDADSVRMDDDQMLALAQTIHERDMGIRRFVDASMKLVSQENVSIKSQLDASGVTEKIVKIIQQNAVSGGFVGQDDVKTNALLAGGMAEELSTNQALREVLYALPNVMPIEDYSVTSDFGVRKHPISGLMHFHTGVDLLSDTDDETVHPVKPGIVVVSQTLPQYGKTVVIRHTNGIESLYAHLANINVKIGDKVTYKSVLGNIGDTGASAKGKHLHFEILVGGYPINPQKVIRTAQYVQQIQTKNQ